MRGLIHATLSALRSHGRPDDVRIAVKQIWNRRLQCECQGTKRPQRRIRQTSFDERNVGSIKFAVKGEFGLRSVGLDSEFLETLAERN